MFYYDRYRLKALITKFNIYYKKIKLQLFDSISDS